MEYREWSTERSVITYMEKDPKINRYMYMCKWTRFCTPGRKDIFQSNLL